jgi:imidazole glycerol phosphate synthase subunit HisF
MQPPQPRDLSLAQAYYRPSTEEIVMFNVEAFQGCRELLLDAS